MGSETIKHLSVSYPFGNKGYSISQVKGLSIPTWNTSSRPAWSLSPASWFLCILKAWKGTVRVNHTAYQGGDLMYSLQVISGNSIYYVKRWGGGHKMRVCRNLSADTC